MFGSILGSVAGSILGAGASLIGSKRQADAIGDAADLNAATQKEFAQQGIRWRVEDAKAAGLHPLAALGAQILPFTPSYVGDTSSGAGIADAGRQLGQGIDRAIAATKTKEERILKDTMSGLQLERMRLENDLLKAQITRVGMPSNPPFPGTATTMPGQGDAYVAELPLERIRSRAGAAFAEPDAVSDVGYVRTPGGGLAKVPSMDAKQRMEDMFIPEVEWFIRNRLNPFAADANPQHIKPPKGYNGWKWSFSKQEYVPVNRTRGRDYRPRRIW